MVKASNAPVHLIIRISATHSFVSNWMKSRANITESKIQTKCNYESALSQRTTKKLIINSKQKMASIPHTVLTSDKVNPAEEISKDASISRAMLLWWSKMASSKLTEKFFRRRVLSLKSC